MACCSVIFSFLCRLSLTNPTLPLSVVIMINKKRIVIAEDYTIVREGLRSLLDSYPDFEVVGEAQDGREAIEYAERHKPDLILMDLSMPKTDGMTAIREIKSRFPEIKILALTVHKTEGYVCRTLEAGADGYLLKDASYSELEMAVRTLLDGKSYLSPGMRRRCSSTRSRSATLPIRSY